MFYSIIVKSNNQLCKIIQRDRVCLTNKTFHRRIINNRYRLSSSFGHGSVDFFIFLPILYNLTRQVQVYRRYAKGVPTADRRHRIMYIAWHTGWSTTWAQLR